jgi:hypothetical protein
MESITPGTVFTDDRGEVAQLHGIGILRVGERWYAWGEDKRDGAGFRAVACYSSTDLARWRPEGAALDATSDPVGTGDLAPGRIVERPKVLARPDGRYVMVLHIDAPDYSDARVGWAIADHPAGPYRYLGSERPLGNLSRDIGVFQEGETAYLLSEDRDRGLHIYRLTDDYCGIAELVVTTMKNDGSHGYESPALVRAAGRYYLFGSDLTGWACNDNMYATANELHGPWSSWRAFAPEGSNTFESQVSVVLPIETEHDTRHVYIGDRWLQHDLARSPAVWLPLEIGQDSARLTWRESWNLGDLGSRPAAAPAGADA